MQSHSATTYLVGQCVMPFCKGCGHTHVLRKLDQALVTLNLRPSDVCLVTDIGCIGLTDAMFELPHTVHTTHGRSTAFAAGIKLADSVLSESRLKVVVLIGDGGAMIGILHLLHAALLNVDITVLLCNNFLFAMTGGQHSSFSPVGFVTPTTPAGNLVPPMDICRVLESCQAGYISRKLATDPDLATTIADALRHPGFSIVEIVELCPEHGTTQNAITGNALREIVENQGQRFDTHVVSTPRFEFGRAYREKNPPDERGWFDRKEDVIVPSCATGPIERVGIIVAGSAGERVQSAARMLCTAAMRAGLYCTQKNDNPVTQGSGFSVSEVILSTEEIHFTGIESPSAALVVSQDGWNELNERGIFKTMTEGSMLILDEELESPSTGATIHRRPFRVESGRNKAAFKAIEYFLKESRILPVQAIEETIR